MNNTDTLQDLKDKTEEWDKVYENKDKDELCIRLYTETRLQRYDLYIDNEDKSLPFIKVERLTDQKSVEDLYLKIKKAYKAKYKEII